MCQPGRKNNNDLWLYCHPKKWITINTHYCVIFRSVKLCPASPTWSSWTWAPTLWQEWPSSHGVLKPSPESDASSSTTLKCPGTPCCSSPGRYLSKNGWLLWSQRSQVFRSYTSSLVWHRILYFPDRQSIHYHCRLLTLKRHPCISFSRLCDFCHHPKFYFYTMLLSLVWCNL